MSGLHRADAPQLARPSSWLGSSLVHTTQPISQPPEAWRRARFVHASILHSECSSPFGIVIASIRPGAIHWSKARQIPEVEASVISTGAGCDLPLKAIRQELRRWQAYLGSLRRSRTKRFDIIHSLRMKPQWGCIAVILRPSRQGAAAKHVSKQAQVVPSHRQSGARKRRVRGQREEVLAAGAFKCNLVLPRAREAHGVRV
jgi:hypothetical protein